MYLSTTSTELSVPLGSTPRCILAADTSGKSAKLWFLDNLEPIFEFKELRVPLLLSNKDEIEFKVSSVPGEELIKFDI